MRLYLVRHAAAEPREDWGADDASRPLTAKGARGAARVGEALAAAGVEPAAIVTSPYLRCAQTARILAEALGGPTSAEEDERLEPGFGPRALAAVIAEREDEGDLMLVGHEPDMSDVIAALAGGARVDLKKGAVARIDISQIEPLAGVLVWLAPPGLLTP